jgi:VanZ family protein
MHDAEHTGSTRDRALRWGPVVAWMCAIFAMSSIPGSNLPGGYSLQGHLAEYAILGALVTRALRARVDPGRLALAALALCAVYAFSDEFHQAFVPLRTPDPLDWTTDVVGAAVGICAAIVARRLGSRR